MGGIFSDQLNVNNIVLTDDSKWTSGNYIGELLKEHGTMNETHGFFNRYYKRTTETNMIKYSKYPGYSFNLDNLKAHRSSNVIVAAFSHARKMSDILNVIFSELKLSKYLQVRDNIYSVTLVF